MKKKSTSKLALLSLRVLLGLFAAFIALALDPSHAVADTSACPTPSGFAYWNGAPTPSPSPLPQLATDFYFKTPFTESPVLVFRGGNVRSQISTCQFWSAGAAYHMVVQDIRADDGAGPDMLFRFEQDDGHALLNGIDAQTWSQNRIGMEGWSNGGIVAYLAAAGAPAPPALRGIQAHLATGDLLNYGLFNGGVWHKEIDWPQSVDLPANTPWVDYVSLPIWNKYLITNSDAGSANVAGLHFGGWFDVFGQGTLDSFSRLQYAGGFPNARGKQKIVIGPWNHGGGGLPGPVGQITFPNSTTGNAMLSDYDAKWKKGVFGNDWNDWNQLPAVKVYLMNPGPSPSGVWTTYTKWPPLGFQFPFYFTKDNKLSGSHQSNANALTFTSRPLDPCPTRGGTNNFNSCVSPSPVPSPVPCGPWDQRPIEAREHDRVHEDVLVFTSDPFATEGTIVGRIHADVWIQTALRDVDVFVRMTDVYPDGRSMLMAQGIQRARYRQRPPPANSTCPQLLQNEATLVRVDMSSTALVVRTGHKLRVIVSASAGPNEAGNPPFVGGYSVNPQNGVDEYLSEPPNPPNAVAGSINVLTGGVNESVLWLSTPGGASPQPDERPNTTPCPN